MKYYSLFRLVLVLLLAAPLAGCADLGRQTPLPTVNLDQIEASETQPPSLSAPQPPAGSVTARAVAVPLQQELVLSPSSGRIAELLVREGSAVRQGELMLRWEGGAQARAAVDAAQLALLEAMQARRQLDEAYPEQKAAAQLRLARAQTALRDAERKRASKEYRNGSEANIQQATADLALANDRLKRANEVFDPLSSRDDTDLLKAGALSELSAAQKAYDTALANLNYLKGMPDSFAIDEADANLAAARTEHESALAGLEKLKNGPDEDLAAAAEARIKAAQSQLEAAKAALASLELAAPFSGTVADLRVHQGQQVLPGAPLLLLMDTSGWQVETTDLSERAIPRVQLGAMAEVHFTALNQDVSGEVTRIAPTADALGGDVVYKVTIRLAEFPPEIRAGMSADVTFP